MENNDKKKQLYQRLETLFSCPKCKKRLEINNYMCGNGHTVCKMCTDGVVLCSLCQAPFTRIPNLFAQNLLHQLNDIKECLTMELNDSRLKSNQSIGKVEKNFNLPTNSKDELTNGQYRCWITNECKFIGNYSAIIKHLKTSHAAEFFELLEGTLPYSNSWKLKYSIGNDFNRAFNIGGLLFIVHMSINEDEDLCACIIMYTGHSLAFRHSCRIEIECDDEKLSYKKGKVLSAQSSEDIILQLKRNVIHITQNKPLYNLLKRKLKFKCSILIDKRRNETNTDEKKGTITANDHQRAIKSINKQQSTVINNKSAIYNKPNLKIIDNQNLPLTPRKKVMESTNKLSLHHVRPHESYVYNQQLYPDLGASSNVNNYVSMVNDNSANAPSAPHMYERPPPINPYFNDYRASMSTNVADTPARQEELNNDKCIVS
ncbi:hypothetical protein PV326_012401 [Microctonus aethiopoides]|nr:hypothetical protein PV326_012401 [Microctonus aethiopoides]